MRVGKNILIYHVGQLGDTLVAMPAIEAISRKYPGHRLVLLTDRHATARGYVSSWDVLGPTEWIDEVMFYEPRDQTRLARTRQLLFMWARLRAYRFEHVYNLALRTTSAAVQRDRVFFCWIVGAKRYESMRALCYPPPKALSGKLPTLEPMWRRLLGVVDTYRYDAGFRIPVASGARAELAKVLPQRLKMPEIQAVALAPGSKMSGKQWAEERFVEVGQQLLAWNPGFVIYVVGGTEDLELGERLCAAWGKGGFNLAGRLSIYGSAALMERCMLYVGNDTGTMHLAAMVGLPCVVIFSARDYPGLWEPYGNEHAILRKDLRCSGCMLEKCVERRKACLENISVDDVLEQVKARLNKYRVRDVALER